MCPGEISALAIDDYSERGGTGLLRIHEAKEIILF